MRGSSGLAMEGGEMDGEEPVSPMGQYGSSSALSLGILIVLESETPIDVSAAMSTLDNLRLSLNPRFSSIMVKDKDGVPKWKRVNVKFEDHVNIPLFPDGLELYDDYLQDYLSKIASIQLPQNLPLWNLHFIKYPTKNAAGTIVLKLHHALGDGFSLMGALFSLAQRVDDPSLPITFPSQQASRQDHKLKFYRSVLRIFSVCFNTVGDFSSSLLKSSFMEDDRTPIRSGEVGVEFRPMTISSITFSLIDIKQIKAKIKGTVNDVMTGIIFYGLQLYMQATNQGNQGTGSIHAGFGSAKVTALVLLNTRAMKTYQTLQEMSQPKSKSPWGNHVAYLHVSIPKCNDVEKVNPLDFVHKAKKIIKAKRNSLGIYLTGGFLEIMRKIKGPEATSQYIHATLKNTSLGISNLMGPMDQVQLMNHPIKGIYFMVTGVPQSLGITILSYMGMVKIAFGTEKDFINSKLLASCMEKSFERMKEATLNNKV